MEKTVIRLLHRTAAGILCLSLTMGTVLPAFADPAQTGEASYEAASTLPSDGGSSAQESDIKQGDASGDSSGASAAAAPSDSTKNPSSDSGSQPAQETAAEPASPETSEFGPLVEELMSVKIRANRKLKKYQYLYIGASRANKLRRCTKDKKTLFETSIGADASWFVLPHRGKKPCLYTIRTYLASRPKGNVIIELGNNNLNLFGTHACIYRKLIEAYPKAHFWFVDVLPGTGPKKGGAKKNADRIRFNEKLKQEFPENCLGGYSYLLHSPGFKTTDGCHYPAYVERNLYVYLMKKLGRKIRYSGSKVIEVK